LDSDKARHILALANFFLSSLTQSLQNRRYGKISLFEQFWLNSGQLRLSIYYYYYHLA